MIKKLLIAGAMTMGVAATAVAAINASGPSKELLEQDLADVRMNIVQVLADVENFKVGSPIRLQHEYRLATLSATEAMLDQKRLSWLRGIELTYRLTGTTQVASVEVLSQLEEDLVAARGEVEMAEVKARTTGGLLQGFALIDVATRKMTVSVLEQRFLMAKYGIFYPEVPEERRRPVPLGNKATDKDAL